VAPDNATALQEGEHSMPRHVPYLVRWFPERQAYGVDGVAAPVMLVPGHATWFAWLDSIASFAFHGRSGLRCTVRKEAMRRGSAYWYGYRSRQGRTVKRYIGRTADLSIGRLEEVAQQIAIAVPRAPAIAETSAEQAMCAPAAAPFPAPPPMTPLLASKLHPPRLPGTLVARTRLLDRLDAGRAHRLTLLSAPAGFGKTTLVCQWMASRAMPVGLSVAWVSLDAADDDPARFWRYVITACQSVYGEIGRVALAQLGGTLPPPFEPPPLETVLTYFLNDIVRCPHDALLVLEDYHAVTMSRIHETLAFVVDHLPPTLRLVILARTAPPLPLVRWRARGDLHELHAADLRFSREEMVTFFQHTLPYALSDKAVGRLDARLEGWAAGLRLLALTMQGQLTSQEVERHLNSLEAGPLRDPIVDYFVGEILHAQPEQLQLFLLQTSMLSRLSGPLCDAVTGRGDGAALLDTLERAGLFLESLDGSGLWYRYHALFAEAMRAAARQRLGDDMVRRLSLQASHWYDRHGLLSEAIDAALHAGEAERAALLIERLTDAASIPFHEFQTLRHWLEELPDGVRRAYPGLCLTYAMALLFTHHPEPPTPALMARVHQALQIADDGWHGRGDLAGRGKVWAFRAMLSWRDGLVEHAARDARQSLAWLPDDEAAPAQAAGDPAHAVWEWRAVNTAIIGHAELEAGRAEEARRLLQEAQRRSTAAGSRPFARVATLLLGSACVALGELHQAEVYYNQVLPDARDQGDEEDVVFVLLCLAELSYEWNDLATVESLLGQTLALGELPNFLEVSDLAALWQARLHHAQGRTMAALQQIAMILARLQAVATPRARIMLPTVLIWQGRLHLACGDLFAAQRSLDTLHRLQDPLSPVQQGTVQLLAARLLIARGQTQDALAPLERLLSAAQEGRQVRQSLEIGLVRAVALAACRRGHEARQQLHLVLSQSRGESFLRLYLDEGEPLATLLRSLLPSLREAALRAYARTILQGFAVTVQPPASPEGAAGPAPLEALSAQERHVWRLLAAGRSNPEIARELFLSVNTVKGHVKNLYRKLDVGTRREATEAARRMVRS